MKKKNNISGYERLKIGSNIRKWRNIKSIKQREMASALNLSEAAISNIENDLTDVTLSQLEDISALLDIPVENLFNDPQDSIATGNYVAENDVPKNHLFLEKEMLYAIIGSIQKKDEQLQTVMQDVLYTMKKVIAGNHAGESFSSH